MPSQPDYDAAAQWAEDDMSLIPGGSSTALHGDAAAERMRALLGEGGPDTPRRGPGRPSLNPTRTGPSHVLKVRVDEQTEQELTAIANERDVPVSVIVRDALAAYLSGR